MIIIYILAAIGGICVLGTIGLIILILFTEEKDEVEICGLTGGRCIYADGISVCNGCHVAEEAEKH